VCWKSSKSVDLGGRRIIKKKSEVKSYLMWWVAKCNKVKRSEVQYWEGGGGESLWETFIGAVSDEK
jgi:hypothetical protein